MEPAKPCSTLGASKNNVPESREQELDKEAELLSAERFYLIDLAVMVAKNLCALRCCLSRVLFNKGTVLFFEYLNAVHILTV